MSDIIINSMKYLSLEDDLNNNKRLKNAMLPARYIEETFGSEFYYNSKFYHFICFSALWNIRKSLIRNTFKSPEPSELTNVLCIFFPV